MQNKYAVITGASSGIGLELARECAKRKYGVFLVARKPDELQKAAQEIREKYKVDSIAIPTDLSTKEGVENLYSALKATGHQIEILINSAGYGIYGEFAQTKIDRHLNLLDLNINALVHLTSLLVPDMIQNKGGKILNVASTASFQPGPLMNTYYASKAFVLSFSEGLRNELRQHGISVTALCPGPTKTNFQNVEKEMMSTRLFKKLPITTAEEVAQAGFDGLMQNAILVIPGTVNKLLAFSTRIAPRRLVTAISRWFLEQTE